jgi:signal transduction histidine kinase/HPt (histidine-containing phosphotransfer) domain-containing protein
MALDPSEAGSTRVPRGAKRAAKNGRAAGGFSLRHLSLAQATAAAIGVAALLLATLAGWASWQAGSAVTELERAHYSRLADEIRGRLDRIASRDQARLAEAAFSTSLYDDLARLEAKPDTGFRPSFADRFATRDGDEFVAVYDLQGTSLFRWAAPGSRGLDRGIVSNALFRILDNRDAAAGLIREGDALFWVAGAPILPSSPASRAQAIRGYVVAGRAFRAGSLSAGPGDVPISLTLSAMPAPQERLGTTASAIAGGDSGRIEFALSDVFAQQNTRAVATTSRAAFRAAERRFQLLFYGTLAMVATLGAGGWWLARRSIVAPVERLAQALAPVHQGQTPALVGTVSTAPEWSLAIGAVNRLLAHVRASQERNERAFAATRDGVWEQDLLTGEWSFSSRFKAMLGDTDAEFPGTQAALVEAMHPDDRETALTRLQESSGNARPIAIDLRLRGKSGSYAWHRLAAQVHTDHNGTPIRFVGRLTSLADEHAARDQVLAARRALAEAERGQGQLLGALAARAGGEPWAADLALLAEGMRGTLGVSVEEFDLHQLLQSLAERTPVRPVPEVTLVPGAPTRVRGDRSLLERALAQLLDNAARAAPRGPASLRVERVDPPAGDAVRLVVQTGGPPLAEAERSRIESLLTVGREPPGDEVKNGLGLRVVHQIAKALGATAGVDAPVEGGSRVWLALALPAVVEEYAETSSPDFGNGASAGPWEGEELWAKAEPAPAPSGAPAAPPAPEPPVELVADATITINLDDDDPPAPIPASFIRQLEAGPARSILALQMAAGFAKDAPLRLRELQGAAADGDQATAAALAHHLGGMAALVGAGRLAASCAAFESAVSERRSEALVPALVEIEERLAQVRSALERYLPPEGSRPVSERPAIDPATVEQLRATIAGDSGGLGSQLVSLFLAEAPIRLDALERAAAAGDSSGLRVAAADLKGMCSLVGATPMAELCAALERAGEGDTVPARTASLRAELARAQRVLERLLHARVTA